MAIQGFSGLPLIPSIPNMPNAPDPAGPAAAAAAGTGGDFAQLLGNAMKSVDAMQGSADAEARKVVSGEAEDLTSAIVASEKARMAMEFTVQVRNKVVEAYQEVWRMPV